MNHFYASIDGWFDFASIYLAAIDEVSGPAHFVEVGAWLGRSTAFLAVEILHSGKPIRLDVVDTWKGTQSDPHMRDYAAARGGVFAEFTENMRPVRDIIRPVQMASVDAARRYADASLDFVFLDADHDFEAVVADIGAWWPKVRAGGIMAGHDYSMPQVAAAVRQYFSLREIRAVNGSFMESWLVRKPDETRTSVSFLYPSRLPQDGMRGWVWMLGRHAKKFRVYCDHDITAAIERDIVFPMTSAHFYTQSILDRHIAQLALAGKPYCVVHHNDHGQPSPWNYPSTVWTRAGERRLADYRPTFVRLPCFPPLLPRHTGPMLMGTFGIVEPKKRTLEMFRRCRDIGVPFIAHGPTGIPQYDDYVQQLRNDGCRVELHDWMPCLEDCAWLAECSHFLFVLPPSKESTGGGSMSPRQATIFYRPVAVVDDEDTYRADGFYVFSDLSEITRGQLEIMAPPYDGWTPDAYLSRLVDLARSGPRRLL